MNGEVDVAASPPSVSLGDWLTDILQQRIANGGYQPGDWIREPALQREFGVSNGPVREAMQNLVAAGVLERVARRGVRVVQLSDKEVVELFQVRLALLELAAELAARTIKPADMKTATDLMETVDHAIAEHDVERLMPSGGALVDWVCRATGNQQLIDVWEQFSLKARVYIYASLKASSDLDSIGPLWRALVESIAANDVPGAREAARGMVRRMVVDLGLESGF